MPIASKSRWKRVACYLPLAAAAGEIPWIILIFLALIFAVGDTPYVNTPGKSRFFDLLSVIPAATGLLFGIVVLLLRWPSNKWDWIALLLGTLGCVAFVLLCLNGFW